MNKLKLVFLSQFSLGYGVSFGVTILLKFNIWILIASNFECLLALGLMFLSALIFRYIIFYFYDYIKIDFWGLENFKAGLKYRENHITRRIKWSKKFGRFGIIVILFFLDPTILAVYNRPGYLDWNGFKNMETRSLFFISNMVGVLTWGNAINWIF